MLLPPSQNRRRKSKQKKKNTTSYSGLQTLVIPGFLAQKKVNQPQQRNVASFSSEINFGVEKIPPMRLLWAASISTGAHP